jgi:hypothetical protein
VPGKEGKPHPETIDMAKGNISLYAEQPVLAALMINYHFNLHESH